MWTIINKIENFKQCELRNLSQWKFGDIWEILPETYLIVMSLVALVTIGMANFKPVANKIEKKTYIMPTQYKFSVNAMWFTIILYVIQLSYVNILNCLTLCWSLFAPKRWFHLDTIPTGDTSHLAYANYAINDIYTAIIKIVVLLTIILIMNSSKESFKNHPRHLIEYPVLLMFTAVFLLILVSAFNFITVFLAILGFSLTLYVLLLNDSFNQASREAGIKYFYLSTVSTGLLICGIFLTYLIFNSTSFMSITWIVHNWKAFNNFDGSTFLITVMLYFIIFGFLFKLAAFPCHLWAPEVYDGSPNAITVLFVLPVKIATFAIFVRILGYTFGELYEYWHYIIWLSAMFSMIWGCLGALTEQTIKRFMAYSSINQMGFLLMGLACGTFEGYQASLIYLWIYVIMNAGFFLLFLCIKEKTINKPLTYLTDFNDFAQKHNIYSVGLVIILFSMAGIPPLAGFVGKYIIFLHSFETGHIGLVIVGMITSVIGAYYYLRIIKIMWFEKPIKNRFKFEVNMSRNLQILIIFLETHLLTFICWLPFVFNVTHILALVAIQPFAQYSWW